MENTPHNPIVPSDSLNAISSEGQTFQHRLMLASRYATLDSLPLSVQFTLAKSTEQIKKLKREDLEDMTHSCLLSIALKDSAIKALINDGIF